ncbi:phosphatidylinositol-glycan biosynthesis class X protein-like [Littorina saxatilis]|uniref:phosphatidylinositol-glycan biosynthesis class X protein-like n=1 Tax=Littorina saxatilis TaxID=31220 RepID=UPI0038B49164
MASQSLNYLIVCIALYMLGVCSSDDVVLEVQRAITKEGFHRDVHTTVSIKPNDIVNTPSRPCSILLIETLPPGLYVDTFQLDSLATFGGPQVLADRHVDIEAPEYLSKEHELHVFAPLPTNSHPSGGPVVVTVSLPVHARYHRPSPDPNVSHTSVTMHHPRVLFNCSRMYSRSTEAPCDVHNSSLCSWAELIYKSDAYSLKFQVPVGHEKDIRVVVYGTMVVTVLGCSFLLYLIAFYGHWNVKVKDR